MRDELIKVMEMVIKIGEKEEIRKEMKRKEMALDEMGAELNAIKLQIKK